ncbi:DMT family transporter [Limnohabitans sp. Rim11]|jgi:drug/metabolite transporter (DMT)-like permease|uniref:DMT family transporter n=1 Tax=Limnohabitans sp. Rim11 TaxID=1100719 RepID=UPI000ABC4771|nr:DMT family transporter [Limnohabitans sp. Rim11]
MQTNETKGMLLGFIGVLMFSLTLPFTRIAVAELSPYFVTFGRSSLGGICALLLFAFTKPKLPTKSQLIRLSVMALGVVYGFPLFVSLAMKTLPSAHGGIVLGVLPLATAVVGALRFNERPSLAFWITAVMGSLLVITYASLNGSGGLASEDWLLFVAIASASIGYSEGGKLSEEMSSVDVISWALVLTLPINIFLTYQYIDFEISAVSTSAIISFVYVGLISMYIAFFFWYRGIALGGVARVGQVQLLQPFLTLVGAYFLLDEQITAMNIGFALCVLAVVVLGKRTRAK